LKSFELQKKELADVLFLKEWSSLRFVLKLPARLNFQFALSAMEPSNSAECRTVADAIFLDFGHNFRQGISSTRGKEMLQVSPASPGSRPGFDSCPHALQPSSLGYYEFQEASAYSRSLHLMIWLPGFGIRGKIRRRLSSHTEPHLRACVKDRPSHSLTLSGRSDSH
jgi:hypothetical protein